MAQSDLKIEGPQLQSLRTEIIESQKARIDLLKYKLLAVAALGTVGLGVGSATSSGADRIIDLPYILCIIPFACMYVDFLCWHNNLRILVIANFLRAYGDPYENFVGKIGQYSHEGTAYFFEMEDLALHYSTIILSSLMLLFGFIDFQHPFFWTRFIFVTTGLVGIVFSLAVRSAYKNRIRALRQASNAVPLDK